MGPFTLDWPEISIGEGECQDITYSYTWNGLNQQGLPDYKSTEWEYKLTERRPDGLTNDLTGWSWLEESIDGTTRSATVQVCVNEDDVIGAQSAILDVMVEPPVFNPQPLVASIPLFASVTAIPVEPCLTMREAANQPRVWTHDWKNKLNWRILDLDSFYFPDVEWRETRIASIGGRGCKDAETVKVAHIIDEGPGIGYIAVGEAQTECRRLGTKSCTMTFNGKTYNLKKASVRKSLRCSNVANMPESKGGTPYLVFDRISHYKKFPKRGFSLANAAFEKDKFLCLPTPKKPGAYPITFDAVDRKEYLKGDGWVFKCTHTPVSSRCAWYFDGGRTLDGSFSSKKVIQVDKEKVTVPRTLY